MIKRKTLLKSAVWGRSILIACALILCAGMARAGSRKLSPDLENRKASDRVDIIVQFSQMPTAAHHRRVLHAGGKLRHEFRSLRAGAYQQVPASVLAELLADPSVVHISGDRQVHMAGSSAPVYLDFHNETMNTAAGWSQGLNGAGVGVVVIDSGIAPVDDLTASNVVYSQDFVGDNGGNPADRFGHGTHVAGIIAGNGTDSTGSLDSYTFQGIAPGVNLISFRVLDNHGNGKDSDTISAIQTAIQLRDTYNIRVINLSLGRGVFESYTTDPLCQAVEQAWQAGIVVVVSAGNEGRNASSGTGGYGTITAPGNDPYVITVGAMNTLGTPDRTDDIPTTYTSRGPTLVDQIVKPDIVAPGNLIVSLYQPGETLSYEYPGNEIPQSLYQTGASGNSSSYFILSGTSMAAPMVSGAAALLLQQNPALTPDQVKARLMLTAFKNLVPYSTITDATSGITYNLQSDIFTVGAGYVDIQAALDNTDLAPPNVGSALSPYATVNSDGTVVMVLGSQYVQPTGLVWGTGMVWGTGLVWGTGMVWGTDTNGDSLVFAPPALAGEGLVWGTSADMAEGLVWGTGMVWGTNSTAAESAAAGDRPRKR